jgi:hypothetical protein
MTVSTEKRGTPPSHNVYGMVEEEINPEDGTGGSK